MTTLIFDWSDWDGPAAGHVVVTRRTWRRAPESLHVPWQVVVPVDGRATLDVAHVAGEVVSIRWAPQGAASRTDHVLIPDGGEHLAHLLDRVDPSTLEPLPEDLPSAVDLVARAEALVARIESGEFQGKAGRGVASITAEGETATVAYTDGTTSTLTLPRGPAGEPGRDGVDGEPGVDGRDGRDGQDGRTPALSWQGTALAVDGVPGPDLRGPAGKDGANGAPGPAPAIKIGAVTSGATPSATITGTSPDLTLGLVLPKGDQGERGERGAPGVVSSASSYVIVGPGRPDQPATTAGTITGAEPVGAEFRSQDGAQVGAFVWMKRPGGAWAVTDGDTGWRDVTALASGWHANYANGFRILARRTDSMAMLKLGLMNATVGGAVSQNSKLFTLTGEVWSFLVGSSRPDHGSLSGAVGRGAANAPFIQAWADVYTAGNFYADHSSTGILTGPPGGPWPSFPLPGSPA